LRAEKGFETDSLDRRIDAALKEYGAAEPRSGLAERILANLRTESMRSAGWHWRNWPTIAVLSTAVMLVAIFLARHLGEPTGAIVAHRSPTAMTNSAAGQVASDGTSSRAAPKSPVRNKEKFGSSARRGGPEKAAAPKLDVFPSPLPLSEQEKMLASYVSEYPKEAALVAQARTEALQRDMEEEMRANETNSAR
jgi:hypothetical protein